MKLPILLFDTDPVAAGVLSMQLRHAGFATHVTFDGAAAIASAVEAIRFNRRHCDLADSQMRHCLSRFATLIPAHGSL